VDSKQQKRHSLVKSSGQQNCVRITPLRGVCRHISARRGAKVPTSVEEWERQRISNTDLGIGRIGNDIVKPPTETNNPTRYPVPEPEAKHHGSNRQGGYSVQNPCLHKKHATYATQRPGQALPAGIDDPTDNKPKGVHDGPLVLFYNWYHRPKRLAGWNSYRGLNKVRGPPSTAPRAEVGL